MPRSVLALLVGPGRCVCRWAAARPRDRHTRACGSEWPISRPARALRSLRRPPHRRCCVAGVWMGASARSPPWPCRRHSNFACNSTPALCWSVSVCNAMSLVFLNCMRLLRGWLPVSLSDPSSSCGCCSQALPPPTGTAARPRRPRAPRPGPLTPSTPVVPGCCVWFGALTRCSARLRHSPRALEISRVKPVSPLLAQA